MRLYGTKNALCAKMHHICYLYCVCLCIYVTHGFVLKNSTEFNFINNRVLCFRQGSKTSSFGTETFPGLQAVSVFITFLEILLINIKWIRIY